MSAQPIDDGGSAFARPGSDWASGKGDLAYANSEKGMTLCEYFAGQALAGLLSNSQMMADLVLTIDANGLRYGQREIAIEIVVRRAFMYGDAMTAERAERKGATR